MVGVVGFVCSMAGGGAVSSRLYRVGTGAVSAEAHGAGSGSVLSVVVVVAVLQGVVVVVVSGSVEVGIESPPLSGGVVVSLQAFGSLF